MFFRLENLYHESINKTSHITYPISHIPQKYHISLQQKLVHQVGQPKKWHVHNFQSSSQWDKGMQVSMIWSWSTTTIFHLFASPLLTFIFVRWIRATTTKWMYWQDIYSGTKSL